MAALCTCTTYGYCILPWKIAALDVTASFAHCSVISAAIARCNVRQPQLGHSARQLFPDTAVHVPGNTRPAHVDIPDMATPACWRGMTASRPPTSRFDTTIAPPSLSRCSGAGQSVPSAVFPVSHSHVIPAVHSRAARTGVTSQS